MTTYLVTRGFPLADVLDFDAYSAVAMYQNLHDQEKRDQASAMIAQRIAVNGDAEVVDKYLKGLGL